MNTEPNFSNQGANLPATAPPYRRYGDIHAYSRPKLYRAGGQL